MGLSELDVLLGAAYPLPAPHIRLIISRAAYSDVASGDVVWCGGGGGGVVCTHVNSLRSQLTQVRQDKPTLREKKNINNWQIFESHHQNK